jgi:3-oxoacyl-[acyl-carrier protein] reductase
MILVIGCSSFIGFEFLKNLKTSENIIGTYNKNKPQIKKKNLKLIKLDISSQNSIINFCKSYLNQKEKITYINFATIKNDSLIFNINNKKLNNELDLNIKGNFLLVQLILKSMIIKKWGRFIHVSSRGAELTDKGTLSYSISKNSLLTLSKVLAKEYGKYNITSNVISLGTFENGLSKYLKNKKIESLLDDIPLKKFIDTKEINLAFNYIKKSNFLNGAKIVIDGGAY